MRPPFPRRAIFEALEPRVLLSASPTLVGTPFDDNDISGYSAIYGTLGDDVIDALGGDDYVYGDGFTSGAGGNDIIVGGDGRDLLLGEEGDDWLEPGPMDQPVLANQTVDGGDGMDTLFLLGAPTSYQFFEYSGGGFIADASHPGAPEGQVAAFNIEQVAFGVSALDYADGTAQPLALVDVSQLVGWGADRAAIAVADTIVGTRGASEILIALPQILGNDIDLDGDLFDIVELLGAPGVNVAGFDASSTSVLPDVPPEYAFDFPDGLVRVQLDAPLTAPVTFGYRLADASSGQVLGNIATVTLQPSPPPTAADDTLRATLGQDNYFDVAALLANDSPGLSFRGIVPGSVTQGDNVSVDDFGSSLHVASFGTTPTSFSFAYEAQDAYGEVVTANVTVEVFNRPPIVADGAAVVAPGGTYTLPFGDLTSFPGTFDPNGDALAMASYALAVPPTVTLMGFEDRIEFAFADDYAGDYVLDFALADATGGQDAGRFRFLTTMPAAPVAVADTLRWGMSTSPGEAFGTFSLSRLLANDVLAPGVKVYGDFTTVAQPANGVFYVEPGNPTSVVPTTDPLNLMLSYMPRAGFIGIDTVTYAIVDELGRRSTTTLTFDVSVPRPVVPETTITLPPGATSVTFPASALLANATLTGTGKLSGYAIRFDADSGVLQATADPVSGNYTSFTYTPDANTVLGQDAFFVGVIDQAAAGGSARASTFVRFVPEGGATVSIQDATVQALEGTAPGAGAILSVLFHRAGDLSGPTTLTYVLEADTRPGASSASANDLEGGFGTRTVTIPSGWNEWTIDFRVTADRNHEADETFVVRLVSAEGGTIGAGSSRVITIANDDPATSDLSLDSRILVGGEIVGVDEFGSPAGTTYTLRLTAANAAGAAIPADARVRITFPDVAIDVRGLMPEDADVMVDDVSATGLRTIWWQVGPLGPGASADLDLQLTSLRPDEVSLVAEIVESTAPDADSTPGNGVGAVEDDALSVVLYGTPGAPPVVRADSFTVAEGGTFTLPPSQGLLVNDDVLRGSTITVSGSHPGVTLSVAPDGGFTFVAPSGITATSVYVYSYTVTDVFGQTSAPATISVQVDDRPSPVGQSDAYVVFEGETLNVSTLLGLLANDAPAPGTRIVENGAPAVGTVTVNADGAFTFVAPAAVTEDTYATFDYVLVDAQGQRSLPIPVTVLVANRQMFADVSVEVLPGQSVYDFGTTQQSVTVRVRNDGPSAVDEMRVAFGYQDFSVLSATTASGTFAFDTGTGSWTVGPLAAGANADLVIITGTAAGGVTPRLTAEITQVRRIGETVLDPDSTAGNGTGRGEDDEATGTWTVSLPQADLGVDVRGGASRVIAGQRLGVAVDVSNFSGLAVDNLVVQVSRGGYGGSTFTFSPSLGTYDPVTGLWTVGALEAGGRATLQLSGSSGTGFGNVSARVQPATVSGVANQDPDSSNDRDSVTWSADPARADLGVDVRGGGSRVIAGQRLSVDVDVSNVGSSGLTTDNVVVQVNRSGYGGSTFTFSPSIGTYDPATGLWTVGTLRPGERATLRLSGASGTGFGSVSASVQPATVYGFANRDPDSGNDFDSTSWSADPARADLGVDVRGGGSRVIAGQRLSVEVDVSNVGGTGLTTDNVVVQVNRSGYGGSTFTFSPSIGIYDPVTGSWAVGTLRSGERATLRLSGASGTGFGSVSASVQSATVNGFANRDPNGSNNVDSASWSVDPAREDLRVDVQRLSSTAPLVDQNVDVEVVVSNAGRTSLATDNVVVQLSRTNYLATTFTPSIGSYDASTGLWTVGTLTPGALATLRLAGSSASAGPADVGASLGIATVLGYNNRDPVAANNSDLESWSLPLPPRPSGLPDDYATDEGVPLVVPATSGLLANDGQLRFTIIDIVTQPDLGSITFQPDGSFIYTPPAHVIADQHTAFTYRLRDASGQTSDPIDVAITVRDVIAPADLSLAMQMVVGGIVQSGENFGFDSGEVFTLRLTARNDGPGDADSVVVRLPWSEAYLAVLGTLPEDADLELDAQGYLWRVGTLAPGGSATLDVEMLTRRGGTLEPNPEIVHSASPDPDSTPGNAATTIEDDEAHFTIVVENAPPYDPEGEDVVPGLLVEEDTSAAIGVSDLMADDVDPENGVLTLVHLIAGLGTASIVDNRDGSLTFTPARDFHGVATFYYQAVDPEGLLGEPVAVRVAVQPANDPPVARDDAVTTNEDTPVTVYLGSNDVDIDGDTLVFGTQAPLPAGTILGTDGRLDFVPPADFSGTVSFEYTVTDNHSPLRTAVVTITIAPVNDAPAAVDDAMAMDEDTTAFVSFAALLANDTDVDGDAMTLVVEDALGLTLTLGQQGGEEGMFVASAFPDYNGTASFTYRVSDAHGASDVASVDVTIRAVQDPPRLVVPLPDVQVDEDALFAIVLPEEAFVDPDGDPIVYRLLLADGSALPGWLAFDTATRTLSGIPPRDFNGTLSIRVMAVEQPEVLAGPAVLASATSFTVNFDGTPLIRLAQTSDTEAVGDNKTRDRTPTFEGDAPASAAMIRLEFLDASLAPLLPTQFALVEADGHWTATADAPLSGRLVFVRASALDENGIDLGAGPLVRAALQLDLTGSPLIGLDPASDTGTPGDNVTEDLTPTLFGEAPSGATSVRLAFESGSGAAVANSVVVPVGPDGQWRYTPSERFAPGVAVGDGRLGTIATLRITATALDAAGIALEPASILNAGALSLWLTGSPVIRLSPVSDSELPGDNVTHDRTPTLEGDLPVGTPAVRLEFYDAAGRAFGTPVTVAADHNGHWAHTVTAPLTTDARNPLVSIVAYAVDNAGVAVGNGGLLRGHLELRFAGSPLLTLDPASDTGTVFDNLTEDRTPTLRGVLPTGATAVRLSFVDATLFAALGEVTVQAGSDGRWAYTPLDAFSLAFGLRGSPETLRVTALALDAAGNALAPATYENSAVLDIRLTGSPLMRLAAASDTGVPGDNITSDRTPTLEGTASVHATSVKLQFADGASGEIVMPDVTVALAPDGTWRYTSDEAFLSRSSIVITATALDAAGSPLSTLAGIDRALLVLAFQGSMLIRLDPGSDTGVPFDHVTSDFTPTFFGEAPLGTDIVVLSLRDGPAGQEDAHAIVVPVGADGRWQWTPLRPLVTSISRSGSLNLVVGARAIDLDGHYADDVFDIEILPTQDPPVAVQDAYTTRENTALTIPVGAGLLVNDHDVDGDVLTVASYGQGLFGTVTVDVDGAFVYTPEIGFNGTDAFIYQVTDGVSMSFATVTVNVQARLLEVVSVTPNESGFSVRFNRAIDTAQVNLYDAGDVTMGAADVVVTGKSTGVVKGTLVLDADASGFTFVKTGGVLAPDTYTVSIRSADGGFIDLRGMSLDGNADGIGGDDASTVFTVLPATSPLLSIADMVRGPGQSANLPLTVVDGAGVTGLSFDILHDTAQVQIDDIVFAAGHSGSIVRTAFAGGTHVTVTLDVALTVGSVAPVRVLAGVPLSAQYGAVGRVALQGVKLTYGASGATESVRTDAGVVAAGYFMDTSGNGAYSMLDVQRLQRVAARLDTGFGAYPNVDPVLIGDLNGNGQISSLDVTRLLQHVQGTPRPEIPALPAGASPLVFTGPARNIGLAGSASAAAGERVAVTLTMDDASGVESVTATIAYDDTRLDYVGVRLLADFPYKLVKQTSGEIVIDLARASAFGVGVGDLLAIDFDVRNGAAGGPALVDLQSLQINEGKLSASVPSQPGIDSTDAQITVIAEVPASPESEALVGGESIGTKGLLRKILAVLSDLQLSVIGAVPDRPSPPPIAEESVHAPLLPDVPPPSVMAATERANPAVIRIDWTPPAGMAASDATEDWKKAPWVKTLNQSLVQRGTPTPSPGGAEGKPSTFKSLLTAPLRR